MRRLGYVSTLSLKDTGVGALDHSVTIWGGDVDFSEAWWEPIRH